MSLPTPDKTWQYNVNQAILAQGTALATNRRILRTIKNSLLGFGTLPWTTRYSCDSVVAGSAGDGVDRWDSDSDLVWAGAGSAHSWYVLRQTGVGATFEVMIACENAAGSGDTLTMRMSPAAGFTGGTTTARPSATDEITLLTGAVWGGTSTTDSAVVLHVKQSTDGQCTRVYVCDATIVQTFWLFDKPRNPITGWADPCIGVVLGVSGTDAPIYANLQAGAGFKIRISANLVGCFGSTEAFGTTVIGQGTVAANEVDGNWPMTSMGLYCNTAAVRGRHGEVFDLWYGHQSAANGDTYPNDASRQFAQFGDVIETWDGTLPLVS